MISVARAKKLGWLALIWLAVWSATADASSMVGFRLYNLDSPGVAPTRDVLALVLPTGAVVPRQVDSDPPTILPSSTGYVSSGFTADDLVVTLGDGEIAGADGAVERFQAIKLDFGPGGLAPGGKLFFQLNLASTYDASLSGLVRLVLPLDVTNMAIETLDLDALSSAEKPPSGGTDIPPSAQVPEPASTAVWLVVAGALLAARKRASLPVCLLHSSSR